MQYYLKYITHLFPVWALLLSAVAFYVPQPFVELKPGIIPLLAVIMLGMGMTLTVEDFKRVVQKPLIILIRPAITISNHATGGLCGINRA